MLLRVDAAQACLTLNKSSRGCRNVPSLPLLSPSLSRSLFASLSRCLSLSLSLLPPLSLTQAEALARRPKPFLRRSRRADRARSDTQRRQRSLPPLPRTLITRLGYVLLVPSVAAEEPPSWEELESLEEARGELFPRRATMFAWWRSVTSSKKKLHAHRSILRAMCLYLLGSPYPTNCWSFRIWNF